MPQRGKSEHLGTPEELQVCCGPDWLLLGVVVVFLNLDHMAGMPVGASNAQAVG